MRSGVQTSRNTRRGGTANGTRNRSSMDCTMAEGKRARNAHWNEVMISKKDWNSFSRYVISTRVGCEGTQTTEEEHRDAVELQWDGCGAENPKGTATAHRRAQRGLRLMTSKRTRAATRACRTAGHHQCGQGWGTALTLIWRFLREPTRSCADCLSQLIRRAMSGSLQASAV